LSKSLCYCGLDTLLGLGGSIRCDGQPIGDPSGRPLTPADAHVELYRRNQRRAEELIELAIHSSKYLSYKAPKHKVSDSGAHLDCCHARRL